MNKKYLTSTDIKKKTHFRLYFFKRFIVKNKKKKIKNFFQFSVVFNAISHYTTFFKNIYLSYFKNFFGTFYFVTHFNWILFLKNIDRSSFNRYFVFNNKVYANLPNVTTASPQILLKTSSAFKTLFLNVIQNHKNKFGLNLTFLYKIKSLYILFVFLALNLN